MKIYAETLIGQKQIKEPYDQINKLKSAERSDPHGVRSQNMNLSKENMT